MKEYAEIKRKGWSIKCPFCQDYIIYTKLINWDVPTPFFYSNKSNDVLLRKRDEAKVSNAFQNSSPDIMELKKIWEEILNEAPLPPNGGIFTFWANINCTHCKKEIPYNKGVQDINLRIYEPHIILIDGAVVVGDDEENTWIVKVDIKKQ